MNLPLLMGIAVFVPFGIMTIWRQKERVANGMFTLTGFLFILGGVADMLEWLTAAGFLTFIGVCVAFLSSFLGRMARLKDHTYQEE